MATQKDFKVKNGLIVGGGDVSVSQGSVSISDQISGDTGQISINNGQNGDSFTRIGITGSGTADSYIRTHSNLDFHIGQSATSTTPSVSIDTSGNIETVGSINIDTADTSLPNIYFSAERFNDTNGKLVFGAGELDPSGGTAGETYIGNHNRRVHIGAVIDGNNHLPTAAVMHMMIDTDGDLFVSQNNTHTKWFEASTRNLSNIGTISSGAITSTSSITANSGGNEIVLGTDGNIEITRTGSGAYIDFKNSTSEDYDQRIQATSTGHSFSGTISNSAFTIPNSIGSAGQVLKVPSSGTTLEWGNDTGLITSITNFADNRILTASGSTTINAEANFTYNGDRISITDGTFTGYIGDNSSVVGGDADDFVISSNQRLVLGSIGYGRIYIDGSDIDVSGNLEINGTQVITSARNLVNIGTISSGAITSTGQFSVNTGATGTLAQFRGADTDLLNIDGDSNAITLDARNVGAFNIEMQGTNALTIDNSQNSTFAGTISSGAITSTGKIETSGKFVSTAGISRFQGGIALGTDDDIYFYESSAGQATLRVGSSGAYKYFTTRIDGYFLAPNGYMVGSTVIVDGSRNLTNIGTISSNAITSSGIFTINEELSGDASQLVINNTQGATLRMGITGSGSNEAAHIKTNAAEALEFHIGQASNTSTPDITFLANGGGIAIQGQTVINNLRNLTNIGTISSGSLTATSNQNQLRLMRTDDTGDDWRFYSWSGGLNIFPSDETSTVWFGRDGQATDVSVYNGNLQIGTTTVIDSSRKILNLHGGMTLQQDGTYGSGYGMLSFSGTTNGHNRIFGANTTNDGLYLMSATGHNVHVRANGNSVTDITLGQDGSYANYSVIGFQSQNVANGTNRIFARSNGTDGLYICSATSRHIYFRTNGAGNNTFRMSSDGNFQMGSTNTTVIDSSRNLTNIGTISSGAISSTSSVEGITLGIDNTSSTTKRGLALYGGGDAATNPEYGIMFTGTAGSGTHGSVTADWATYFTMNATANRGWIFKTQGSANVASISNTGNAAFNGTITAGNSTTSAHIRSHFSDGSYMTLYGYGLEMNRTASYIRPSTDGNKTLYVGAADATKDWYAIHFRSSQGLHITGTQFLDASRNLVNIGTISSGMQTITYTGTTIPSNDATGLRVVDSRTAAADVGGSISLTGAYNGTTLLGGSPYIRAYKANSSQGDYSFGLKFGIRKNGVGTAAQALQIDEDKNATFAGTISSGAITVDDGNIVQQSADVGGVTPPEIYIGQLNNAYQGGIQSQVHLTFKTTNNAGGFYWYKQSGIPMQLVSNNLSVNLGDYQINGTTVIDSSRNLTNIGTISSGAITSSSTIKVSSGSNEVLLNTDGAVEITRSAGNPYIDFKNSTSDDYDQRLQINSGNFNFSSPLQVAGTTFIDTSLNLSNIGTISSGAINCGSIHTSAGLTFGQPDHFLGDEGGQNDSETLLLRNGASASGNSGIKILAGYNDGGDTSGKIQFYTNGSTTSPKLEIDIDGNIKMGSTQIISNGRNLTNIGTISSGAITSSGRIKTTNGLFQADEGSQKVRQYEIGSSQGTQTFLLGKIRHISAGDGAVTGTVKAAYDYGDTTNNCNIHFTFAQRSGSARGHWWYENTDDDSGTDVVSVRLVDDGSGNMFVWLYVGDYVHCFVETVWRQCSSVSDSGTLSAGTITTGTTLFDTVNDPTSEMHIGKLYAHDDINLEPSSSIHMDFGAGMTSDIVTSSSSTVKFGGISTNDDVTAQLVAFGENGIFEVGDGETTIQGSHGELLNFKTSSSTTEGSIGSRSESSYNLFMEASSSTSAVGFKIMTAFGSHYISPSQDQGATADNMLRLGYLSNRYVELYAVDGSINTSDRNEKQDIQALSDAEQRVAVACKGLIRRYKWNHAVEEKGDDARYHFGIIAQDLQDAFTAEGLDAGDYGMFISDTWTDDDGVEQTRLGVRYNELLAFIIATL